MSNKVVDFELGKENQLHKRKEAKLDAMRRAFKLARADSAKAGGKQNKRGKTKKK